MDNKGIDWVKVQTAAVSAMMVTVVLGFCGLLWQGVTTVDERIEENTKGVSNAVSRIEAAQGVLGTEVESLKKVIAELISELNKCEHIEKDFKPYRPPKLRIVEEIRKEHRNLMQQQTQRP